MDSGPRRGLRARAWPAALIAALIAGCGGGDQLPRVDLSGTRLTLGTVEATEQAILGELAFQILDGAGAAVERRAFENRDAARVALEDGEIDLYWEQTGRAWTELLDGEEPIRDRREQFEAVAEQDREENRIMWLDPALMNSTWAIAARSDGEQLDEVETISDLGELIRNDPELATVCVVAELDDQDEEGFPGLQEAYELEVPTDKLSLVDQGAIYRELSSGRRCNFGSVHATDGRLAALELRTLEDDRSFFGFLNPALTVREQAYEAVPGLAELLRPLTDALDEDAIAGLNAEVDLVGRAPADVARGFLVRSGLL